MPSKPTSNSTKRTSSSQGSKEPTTAPSRAQEPTTPSRAEKPTKPSQAQKPTTPSQAQVPTTLPSTAQVSPVGPTSQDPELEGFIYTLSPIKKANNKSKTPYFDCLVQTSNASKVRAVCYETEKRITLQQAYNSKSPVKISGVKRLPSASFSESLEECKIAKMAKITPTMIEFHYNPDVASSIYSVQQALDGDAYKTIDVTAKVVNKENNKQAIVSKGKQLLKTECVIADHTNTIALTLWEDLIDAVDCGKTQFQECKN
ncbi:Disintegrin and metalloproteinase domain-containing protein 29 [Stylophora pistillata]|uniref:Disintegrin and metalloproteinase domain-containing protein 29 n=1 Tax=Stylophora pistillata TaxID=50429 RepID=A0A2B4R414_STYPI|nr:Disintegrin and metalloproteinase domain-containing protein 29 [Stylophora pistillata]